MLHKIRTLLAQDSEPLSGEIECDEVYIGGREKNMHLSRRTEKNQGRSVKTKTPVFGMVERNGNVIARKVSDTAGVTLMGNIRRFVRKGSRVYTDEWIGYHTLEESEYTHMTIHHKADEFVNGEIYTNTIEGFWGQLKRMIIGVYHFTSAKYLQRYIDEAAFRYNTAFYDEGARFEMMMDKAMGKRSYEFIKECVA